MHAKSPASMQDKAVPKIYQLFAGNINAMPERPIAEKWLFLLAPRVNFTFLANTQCDSAVGTVPLRRSRWDLLQIYAFQMEPFLLALHIH